MRSTEIIEELYNSGELSAEEALHKVFDIYNRPAEIENQGFSLEYEDYGIYKLRNRHTETVKCKDSEASCAEYVYTCRKLDQPHWRFKNPLLAAIRKKDD